MSQLGRSSRNAHTRRRSCIDPDHDADAAAARARAEAAPFAAADAHAGSVALAATDRSDPAT